MGVLAPESAHARLSAQLPTTPAEFFWYTCLGEEGEGAQKCLENWLINFLAISGNLKLFWGFIRRKKTLKIAHPGNTKEILKKHMQEVYPGSKVLEAFYCGKCVSSGK
jgi:hypothetical protein